MTKAERAAKTKRAAAARRKSKAVTEFLRKVNPALKLKNLEGVRMKRHKGGSITLTPIKRRK